MWASGYARPLKVGADRGDVDAVLTEVLRKFATTLGRDFSIQAILDHLTTRIVDVLPITGAGVA